MEKCESCIHKNVCKIMETGDMLSEIIKDANMFHSDNFELNCKQYKSSKEQYVFPDFGRPSFPYVTPNTIPTTLPNIPTPKGDPNRILCCDESSAVMDYMVTETKIQNNRN